MTDARLAEHPFFADLADTTIAAVSRCAVEVDFATDEHPFQADEPADHFYVIERGRMAIEIDTPRQGPIVISTLGPGEILGVSWMLPPYRWTFDARAVEPTVALMIDAACLRDICDDDPAIGYPLYKRFARLVHDRLVAARLQMIDLYGNRAS
jgi:CRP/FNR family cyclic AMP-dependent transcriptional regulator